MGTSQGLIIVFTGDGKGKTSAALGIALRAAGHRKRSVIVQFLKEGLRSGEQVLECPFIEVRASGAGFFTQGSDPEPHKRAAENGLKIARNLMTSGSVDIVVLDEISHAVNFGFLSTTTIVDTLKQKKDALHVILTGRNMPREITDIAHVVTEMKEIRHPYQSGNAAVEGIDF
ncbi:MAG: cob(I)yrinic acid a,c-diamide adenosyltransferase [Syntrophorhabdaceae bacterium]